MSRRLVQAAGCVVSLALVPVAGAHALTLSQLRAKLAAYSHRMGSSSGAFVQDLGSGRTLYSSHADTARSPASNEKLLTTSTALLRFGPAATFRTRLVAAAEPVNGVIHGDVALVGAGDPYLSRTQLRLIAGQLDALGVTKITGNIVGDGSLLDNRRGSYDSGYAYDSDIGGSLGGLVVEEGRGRDPALHAASELRSVLLAADIGVGGRSKSGSLGAGAPEIASVASPPLSNEIERINVPSDNFAAELLLKDLGAGFGTAGSTPAGAAVVSSTMAGIGVRARVVDGSGLSRTDRISPRQVVNLLAAMTTGAQGALRATLPVAGRTGTLADRMRGTAAQDSCQAKTGTLNDVSALSGYCSVSSGADTIAFSLLENRVCSSCAKGVEDRMVAAIARYSP